MNGSDAVSLPSLLSVRLFREKRLRSAAFAGDEFEFPVKMKIVTASGHEFGKSPDAFTNVIESESDNTGGLINDYGAVVEY